MQDKYILPMIYLLCENGFLPARLHWRWSLRCRVSILKKKYQW